MRLIASNFFLSLPSIIKNLRTNLKGDNDGSYSECPVDKKKKSLISLHGVNSFLSHFIKLCNFPNVSVSIFLLININLVAPQKQGALI